MKLLLKLDVLGLGLCGDEVEVKDGYGRNFLIPNGHAILATPKNIKQFNHQKNIIQARLKKGKISAIEQAQKIENVSCVFEKKVGDNGKLFGTVTTQDISESLRSHGIELDRRKLKLKEPIKSIGAFDLSVKLHPEVTATIKISVVQEAVKKEKANENNKKEGKVKNDNKSKKNKETN